MASLSSFNNRKRNRTGSAPDAINQTIVLSESLSIFQSPTKKPTTLANRAATPKTSTFSPSTNKSPVSASTSVSSKPSAAQSSKVSSSPKSSPKSPNRTTTKHDRIHKNSTPNFTTPPPVAAAPSITTVSPSRLLSHTLLSGSLSPTVGVKSVPKPVSAPTTPVARSGPSVPSSPNLNSSSSRSMPPSGAKTGLTGGNAKTAPVLHRSQSSVTSSSSNGSTLPRDVYYVVDSAETEVLEENCSLPKESTLGDVPSWALPRLVVDILKNRGVQRVHDWQSECLRTTGVIDGKSLVYSLPTSGGKTYVAEMLLLRMAHVHRKVAIFVLPYVSIVTEKVKSLKDFGKRLSFAVEGYFQNNGKLPLPKNVPTLCVCTIEKANALVNSLIEEGRLNEVGLVVFDELHMLGDPSRGYLLEILGTKLKFASNNSIQMVGMSATLPNLNDLATWLNGNAFYRNFRPVKLVEHVFDGFDLLTTTIVDPSQNDQTQSPSPTRAHSGPPNAKSPPKIHPTKSYHIAKHIGTINWTELTNAQIGPVSTLQPQMVFAAFHLVRQLMPHNCALVFCNSRAMTSKLALAFADLFIRFPPVNSYDLSIINWKPGSETSSLRFDSQHLVMSPEEFQQKMDKLKDDRKLLVRRIASMSPSKRVDADLELCIHQGVAWHNADLGTVERDLLETAFREKVISVICCTSTLAAGVNLPARRVILMSNKMGREDLSVGEYRQMVGRAGRAGIDDIGESFLFVPTSRVNPGGMIPVSTPDTHHKAIRLLVQALSAVKSPLGSPTGSDSEFNFLRRARQTLYLRSKSDLRIEVAQEVDLDRSVVQNFQKPDWPIYSYFCASYLPLPPDTPAETLALYKKYGQVSPTGCGIDRLILDAIAGRCAVTLPEIRRFVSCTFLAATLKVEDMGNLIERSLRLLQTIKMIDFIPPEEANVRQQQDPDYESNDPNDPTANTFKGKPRCLMRDYWQAEQLEEDAEFPLVYVVTTFGAATYRTPFSLEVAMYMREEIEKSLDSFVLSEDLHLCWLVLPIQSYLGPTSVEIWRQIMERILPTPKRPSHALEQDEGDGSKMKIDMPPPSSDLEVPVTGILKTQRKFAARVGATPEALLGDSKYEAATHPSWQPTQRFMLTLVLQEIVNECQVSIVAAKYGLSNGDIENMMQLASNQAGQLVGFCKRMGWGHLEALFKVFAIRVAAGVKEDIMPLMKVKGVKAVRARMLYAAGFHSIRALALAQDFELAKALSSRGGQDPTSVKLAKKIIASAQKVLDMKANELRATAHLMTESEETNTKPTAKRTKAKRVRTYGSQRAKRTASQADMGPTSSLAPVTSQISQTSQLSQLSVAESLNESKVLAEAFWDYDPNLSDDEELEEIELEMALMAENVERERANRMQNNR